VDIGGSAECSKEREMLQEDEGRRGEGGGGRGGRGGGGEGREEREGEV
jgi:hypothetical protein